MNLGLFLSYSLKQIFKLLEGNLCPGCAPTRLSVHRYLLKGLVCYTGLFYSTQCPDKCLQLYFQMIYRLYIYMYIYIYTHTYIYIYQKSFLFKRTNLQQLFLICNSSCKINKHSPDLTVLQLYCWGGLTYFICLFIYTILPRPGIFSLKTIVSTGEHHGQNLCQEPNAL